MRKVTDTEKHIILGSASPRRRELLSELGFEFEVDTENSFEEKFDPQTPHWEIPLLLSKGKSHGFHRPLSENEVLITADTLVLCGEEIMGKPHSEEEARQMLKHLSGREHEVITGVTIRDAFRENRSQTDVSCVLPLSAKKTSTFTSKTSNPLTKPEPMASRNG